MNKKKLIKFAKTFFPLALGVFFIYYSYQGFSPEERRQLIANIKQVNPIWIIISIIGGLLSHMSRAYRWKLLIEPLGYKLRFSTGFMAVMGGYLANLGIPRSGEVLRGATAATYDKIPFEKVFGTIIAERAIDVIMVLLLVVLAVLFHTQELFAIFDKFGINPWVSLIGILLLLLLGILFLRALQRSQFTPFVKLRRFIDGILEGVKSILHLKKPGVFIAHTLFIWTMYVSMFYLLKYGFPALEHLSFGVMLSAFVVGSFSISITNGGIGIYPLAVGGVLALFGVSHEAGEAFGWVDWGTQNILSIVVGGASLILLPILNRKNPKDQVPPKASINH